MKLLHDLVLIKPTEEKESVLVKPTSSKETPSTGTVIEVGPDVSTALRKKRVVYRKWMGDEVIFDDKKYIILREEDILITDYPIK
jgi:co-chaperonin GroES (HSP10)